MKIVWLRRDLRVDDNSALYLASQSGEPVIAVYIATPETWAAHSMAPIQADLIYRRLFALKTELSTINIPLFYAQVATFKQSADLLAEMAAFNHISGVLFQ